MSARSLIFALMIIVFCQMVFISAKTRSSVFDQDTNGQRAICVPPCAGGKTCYGTLSCDEFVQRAGLYAGTYLINCPPFNAQTPFQCLTFSEAYTAKQKGK